GMKPSNAWPALKPIITGRPASSSSLIKSSAAPPVISSSAPALQSSQTFVDRGAVPALPPPVHHHRRRHRAAADGVGADGVAAAHVVELPEVRDTRQHDVVERARLEFGRLGE